MSSKPPLLALAVALAILLAFPPFPAVSEAAARTATQCDESGWGEETADCPNGYCDAGDYATVAASVDDNGAISGTAACNGVIGPQGQAYAHCDGTGYCDNNSYPGTTASGGSLQCTATGDGGWWTHVHVYCGSNPSGLSDTCTGTACLDEGALLNRNPVGFSGVPVPPGVCEDDIPLGLACLCLQCGYAGAAVTIDARNVAGVIHATALRCQGVHCVSVPVKVSRVASLRPGATGPFTLSA